MTGGQAAQVIAAAPPQLQGTVAHAAASGFVDALNHICAIAATIAFVAGALCLVLIRQRDFEDHHGHGPAATSPGPRDPSRVGQPVG